jgi:ABC transport system ATP-binding/permease protein
VLAPEPDILLLDEPTNHLDVVGIEGLEAALEITRSAMVLISHDRRFLENLSQATVWLDRGSTRRLDKGFAAFESMARCHS